MEPAAAFRVRDHERPGLEVRINFGMLTGREATRAEIDHLAHALRRLAPTAVSARPLSSSVPWQRPAITCTVNRPRKSGASVNERETERSAPRASETA